MFRNQYIGAVMGILQVGHISASPSICHKLFKLYRTQFNVANMFWLDKYFNTFFIANDLRYPNRQMISALIYKYKIFLKEWKWKEEDLNVNPSIGDSKRTVLLDEMVDFLSNGRGLLTSHLGVDFPQILRALSREMPHERCSSKHTGTTGPRNSTASEPHLCSESDTFPPYPLTTHYFFYLGFRALALHRHRDSHSHQRIQQKE